MNEVTTWDYEASVKRVRPMVIRWKTLTLDVYHELWEAREHLRNQGTRTDLTSGQMSRSWEGYCEDVGLSKRTVNRWLSGYDESERKPIERPKPVARETPKQPVEEPEQAPVVAMDADPLLQDAPTLRRRFDLLREEIEAAFITTVKKARATDKSSDYLAGVEAVARELQGTVSMRSTLAFIKKNMRSSRVAE